MWRRREIWRHLSRLPKAGQLEVERLLPEREAEMRKKRRRGNFGMRKKNLSKRVDKKLSLL